MHRHLAGRRVGERLRGQPGQVLGGQRPDQLRQQGRHARVHHRRMREPARIRRQTCTEVVGGLLERAVLQQPGEQQITLAQRLHAALVAPAVLVAGQQRGAFGLHQDRGDVDERTGGLHVARHIHAPDILQELLGDRRERNLGQFQAIAGDHAQQHVERAGIHVQTDGESGVDGTPLRLRQLCPFHHGHAAGQGTMPLAISSRATSRYSLAVLCPGA